MFTMVYASSGGTSNLSTLPRSKRLRERKKTGRPGGGGGEGGGSVDLGHQGLGPFNWALLLEGPSKGPFRMKGLPGALPGERAPKSARDSPRLRLPLQLVFGQLPLVLPPPRAQDLLRMKGMAALKFHTLATLGVADTPSWGCGRPAAAAA